MQDHRPAGFVGFRVGLGEQGVVGGALVVAIVLRAGVGLQQPQEGHRVVEVGVPAHHPHLEVPVAIGGEGDRGVVLGDGGVDADRPPVGLHRLSQQ